MQCDAPGDPDDAAKANDEWVDIRNAGEATASMMGWVVTDGASRYLFEAGFRLGAGGTVRLHTGSGRDSVTELYWGRTDHVWDPGETAQIIESEDQPLTWAMCPSD